MRFSVARTNWDCIKPIVQEYLANLSSPTDSFWEEKLLEARLYGIVKENRPIGFFTIYKEQTLTSFYLTDEYLDQAQELFQLALRREFVQQALVATCDEQFLSLSIDCAKRVDRQAYFFHKRDEKKSVASIQLRLALEEDLSIIQDNSDDFFDEAEKQIHLKEIFLAYQEEDLIGFGVYERGRLREAFVSIGMYVLPEYRLKGYGADILKGLQMQAESDGFTPIAGCWIWNHGSKKTLERAGLASTTRYLKISF